MIKTKLLNIINLKTALESLNKNITFKGKDAYSLAVLLRKIEHYTAPFEEVKKSVVEKYKKEFDNEEEVIAKSNLELQEIANEESEFDIWNLDIDFWDQTVDPIALKVIMDAMSDQFNPTFS